MFVYLVFCILFLVLFMFNSISFLDKVLFTKHLAVMIKSGIPLSEGLEALTTQARSTAFKKVLQEITKNVINGQQLAKAMSKHPNAFSEFYLGLIKVGEESGTLEENLSFLAEQMAKDYKLRKKIQGAMLYPGLVLSATVIMGSFIGVFILPKLIDFFAAFEVELPLTTRILLWLAHLMKTYGFLLVFGLLIFALASYFLLRTSYLKYHWHRLVLKFPIFGELFSYAQLARFARNLGTLLKTGVPIIKSLEITANTLDNLAFRKQLILAKEQIEKGKELGKSLEKTGTLFPPIVCKMITVGEKTGKLDEVLIYLGDFYDEEIDSISKNLSTVLEPILLVIIGLIVGFVALAIISPIYELTGSIRR